MEEKYSLEKNADIQKQQAKKRLDLFFLSSTEKLVSNVSSYPSLYNFHGFPLVVEKEEYKIKVNPKIEKTKL